MIHCPITKISKFLDRHLRPLFNNICEKIIIIDGTDLIRKLELYQKEGRLKQSTLFCTFDIHNLYTMLPQEDSLKILKEFLETHHIKRVKGIDLQTIQELASLVLRENVFVYGEKIYQQIIGGAMGSALTQDLANIFMWKWQEELVQDQQETGEFFGR